MAVTASDLRCRITIYRKKKAENELKETTYEYRPERTVWAQIVPASGRAAALEGDYGEFLEGQGLSQTDHTTSFCYVFLEDDWDQEDTVGYLAGLTEAQKSDLWRRFLQDHLHPPEFEWLRDALIRDCVPNWIECHLALYRLMEQLGIHFLCQEGHFQMLDAAGKRLYFGVDHADAAEQMLMKILFPLNQ